MNKAQSIMEQANPNAVIGREADAVVMIEDITDPDDRLYRIEYQSTEDGKHAIAWCRYNPWGSLNGGEDYTKCHVADDGFICVGTESIRTLQESPYSLSYVLERARYWCVAFSVYMESGTFPQP